MGNIDLLITLTEPPELASSPLVLRQSLQAYLVTLIPSIIIYDIRRFGKFLAMQGCIAHKDYKDAPL